MCCVLLRRGEDRLDDMTSARRVDTKWVIVAFVAVILLIINLSRYTQQSIHIVPKKNRNNHDLFNSFILLENTDVTN